MQNPSGSGAIGGSDGRGFSWTDQKPTGSDGAGTSRAQTATGQNATENAKRVQAVMERMFRNIIGEVGDAPAFAPFDSVEGVRYNAEQDVKDVIDAHARFEQFFCKKRLVYSQRHPEEILKARVADLKKCVVRKDALIRRHHQHLARWSGILKGGTSPTSSAPEKQEASAQAAASQPTEPPAKRHEPSRPPQSYSAIPQPVGSASVPQPVFPAPAPTSSYSYNQSNPQGFGPGAAPSPGMPYQRPGIRQAGMPTPPYGGPRVPMQNVGYPSGGTIMAQPQFGPRSSPLSSMLQSGANPMRQPGPHAMGNPSPNVPSPLGYGQTTGSPRMAWRQGAPMPGQQQQMHYGGEEGQSGVVYHQHMHGPETPNIPPPGGQ